MDTGAANNYVRVCREVGCEPSHEFLRCLQTGNTSCKLKPNKRCEEQLYATLSMLPFAGLTEFDVSDSSLTAEAWLALANTCGRCTTIQALSLRSCGLGNLDAALQVQFAKVLGQCQLEYLDVSRNTLGDEFIQGLKESGVLRRGRLSVLNLSENHISDAGGVQLAAALDTAGSACALAELDLSFNSLGDRTAAALGAAIGNDTRGRVSRLHVLELEGNQIGDDGGRSLARGLETTVALRRLNLNYNAHGSSTLTAVGKALRLNPDTLRELTVAGSSGSERSAVELLQAAAGSSSVQVLDVRGVHLRANGVDAVCHLLQATRSLTTLRADVDSREGAETVAAALVGNSSLMSLTLGGPVPEHVLTAISEQLSASIVGRRTLPPAAATSAARPYDARKLQSAPAQRTSASNIVAAPPHDTQRRGPANSAHPEPAPAGGRARRPAQNGDVQRPASAGRALSANSRGNGNGATAIGSSIRRASSGVVPGRISEHVTGVNHRTGGAASARSSTHPVASILSGPAAAGGATHHHAGSGGGGGGSSGQEHLAQVFHKHTQDNGRSLDGQEVMAALAELGLLEGMKARQLGKLITAAIRANAAADGSGMSWDAFLSCYQRLIAHQADSGRAPTAGIPRARQGHAQLHRHPSMPVDTPSNPVLRRTFKAHCRLPIGQGRAVGASQQHINSAQFLRMCEEAGLLEPRGPLARVTVDIIFARCKLFGMHRLPYKEFLEAVALVVEESGWGWDKLLTALDAGAQDESAQAAAAVPPPAATAAGAQAAGAPSRANVLTSHFRLSGSLMNSATAPVADSARADSALTNPETSFASPPQSSSPAPGFGGFGALGGHGLHGAEARLSVTNPLYDQYEEESETLRAVPAGASGQYFTSQMRGVGRHQSDDSPLNQRHAPLKVLAATQSAPSNPAEATDTAAQAQVASLTKQVQELQLLIQNLQEQQRQQQQQQEQEQQQALNPADVAPSIPVPPPAVVQQQQQQQQQQWQEPAAAPPLARSQHEAQYIVATVSTADRAYIDAMEKRIMERQGRGEAALMQVARQVDLLELRLKEEQESSLRALEVLANASPPRLTPQRT